MTALARIDAGERLGSALLWALFAGAPGLVFGCAAGGWGAVAGAGVGAGLIAAMVRGRRRAAAAKLAGGGEARYPTWLAPMRAPTASRLLDGVKVRRRVHALRVDGRALSAELIVEAATGSQFVAWVASRSRPPAARRMPMLTEVVIGGVLIASPDPLATARRLGSPDARARLRAALPADGELVAEPDALWWRVRGPVDPARFDAAAAALLGLAGALNERSPYR